MRYPILYTLSFMLLFSCKKEQAKDLTSDYLQAPSGTTPIPEADQRNGGDPEKGQAFLYEGGFINSGLPREMVELLPQFQSDGNLLGRNGIQADLPYNASQSTAPNGAAVVNVNCFLCHANKVNGELIVGLGNSNFNSTIDQAELLPLADASMEFYGYGPGTPEWEAYLPFRRYTQATSASAKMDIIGVHSAGQFLRDLAAHRDPVSLHWQDSILFDPKTKDYNVPSDVPAWWLLKKKNAHFMTGFGRGDHTKYLSGFIMADITDSAHARVLIEQFEDVHAFINALEPPAYPKPINFDLATKGEALFLEHCAKCHGTYGTEPTYPNLLVDVETLDTDVELAICASENTAFLNWWNDSWFGQTQPKTEMVQTHGYIAPPLDGIWITAPYLHNASVPDLESLLHSPSRPTYWKRDFDNTEYDYQTVGWKYEPVDQGGEPDIYDTTKKGYGNGGHLYGNVLTDEERAAVIEYLKTL